MVFQCLCHRRNETLQMLRINSILWIWETISLRSENHEPAAVVHRTGTRERPRRENYRDMLEGKNMKHFAPSLAFSHLPYKVNVITFLESYLIF